MPRYNGNFWEYYSDKVPEYIDKYSRRGMRERNQKLLKLLKKPKNEALESYYREQLIENNLPLAMAVAESMGRSFGWNRQDVEDAYQECCIKLTECIRKIPNDISQNHFQVQIHHQMLWHLLNLEKGKTKEIETVSFEEESYPVEEEYKSDKELVRFLLDATPLPEKRKEILKLYYFGDSQKYIEPLNLEDIGMYIGLTREAVRQNKEKAIKKIKKFITYVFKEKNNTALKKEYFFNE